MTKTKKDYIQRINLILDFIDNNLDVKLSLDVLAKKAHYSPYHFHRVFLTVVGERVNEYIRRKRLERIASVLLVDCDVPLKELSYKYGFNSDNSFSRAFKKYYGVSPTIFKSERKEILRKIGIVPFSMDEYICSIDDSNNWIRMNGQISIKELPAMRFAGISHFGDFDKAGALFQRLMKWGHQHKVIEYSKFKAATVYHDNPSVTESSKVRYSACITISKDIEADGDIRQVNIQEGIYAVGHFEIGTEEVSMAWKSMCVWVIENGYEFRDGEYFELYHNDHNTHPEGKLIVDICIPLVKAAGMNLEEVSNLEISDSGRPNSQSVDGLDYHQLINYMKELKAYFRKEYESYFTVGSLNQSSSEYAYFPLTTDELKKLKLKYVLILNHKLMQFEICLSGQNKRIRKQYWEMVKWSDWEKYHLPESIDKSLAIIDHIIVKDPDFGNTKNLCVEIEKEAMIFINDIQDLLK